MLLMALLALISVQPTRTYRALDDGPSTHISSDVLVSGKMIGSKSLPTIVSIPLQATHTGHDTNSWP